MCCVQNQPHCFKIMLLPSKWGSNLHLSLLGGDKQKINKQQAAFTHTYFFQNPSKKETQNKLSPSMCVLIFHLYNQPHSSPTFSNFIQLPYMKKMSSSLYFNIFTSFWCRRWIRWSNWQFWKSIIEKNVKRKIWIFHWR